ncbi:MAG: 30S ribosomal protein S5 alanine N-acetyltransferase [Rhodospirillaceae bacterium]|nr:30S ribosomal protein S5 alanine N-acetyltransferase [Alphaproteobacteria bacterium]MBR73010.1 30S ribosomal protein S5 alanine N-acetyltransferase [Rhodospirillaceae bacterium]|tara:strand:- start:10938 stop:11540 length:603 start_codon:yes stop_codon:yes gene_type:complete
MEKYKKENTFRFKDTLLGKNVFLRHPKSKDWEEWAKLRSESRSFLQPWEPTWTVDALTRRKFHKRIQRQRRELGSQQSYPFFIFHKADGYLLGGITIANIQRGVSKSATIGYWMGEKYSRKGYMSDGLNIILMHSFSELKIHRLQAFCMPNNISSKKLLENTGFRIEGKIRKYLYINSCWEDHLFYNILSEDWDKLSVLR